MAMKINKLEIENVKRVKAVTLKPMENGLTIIGGENGQGKTSVLDAIAWTLGGNSFKPSQPVREGSAQPPTMKITMNNGLIVERKGKNSELKVTDPTGQKAGQQLLNSFVEGFAINLPKFMESTSKEKASTLLKIIGVDEQLATLEQEERDLYSERLFVGRTAEQKTKFAEEQTYYPDAPKDLISPSDLIRQQQEILAKNGENQLRRRQLADIAENRRRISSEIEKTARQIQELHDREAQLQAELANVIKDEKTAMKTVEELKDESTEELESSIANVEEINRKVRANLDKEKAEEDAKAYTDKYNLLSLNLEAVRKQKKDLLNNAKLPLPDLSVSEGELIYRGQKWDNMSGAERLIVSTSIVKMLNPNCGFVLLDKLEQLDLKTLESFGKWLEAEGLQAIATRVSTGEECSIIIEDGYVLKQQEIQQPTIQKKWEAGKF